MVSGSQKTVEEWKSISNREKREEKEIDSGQEKMEEEEEKSSRGPMSGKSNRQRE